MGRYALFQRAQGDGGDRALHPLRKHRNAVSEEGAGFDLDESIDTLVMDLEIEPVSSVSDFVSDDTGGFVAGYQPVFEEKGSDTIRRLRVERDEVVVALECDD